MPKCEHADKPFKAGDIIGFSGSAWSSDFINVVTYGVPRWSISHVAIVANYNGELLLFESTIDHDLPCIIQGHRVEGVQAHPIAERIATYQGKAYHYPLTRSLYQHEDRRLTRFLLEQVGNRYDKAGAFRAGGFAFAACESLLHEEARNAFFCSALAAAAHNEIGIFPTAHVARWNPNALVRAERFTGILKQPHRLNEICRHSAYRAGRLSG